MTLYKLISQKKGRVNAIDFQEIYPEVKVLVAFLSDAT
jgi:hypothetical protein